MERYARGDDAAFADLYDALAPRLFAFLVRRSGDRQHAEDLVHDTMLRIHRARGRFIPGADVLPWAFAIARRLQIDSSRRGRREFLARTDEPEGERVQNDSGNREAAADEVFQAQELAARLQSELARLPDAQRIAFELIKQEGLSVAEAAQVLGITVSAVKLRAHRAYVSLREVIGDEDGKGGAE